MEVQHIFRLYPATFFFLSQKYEVSKTTELMRAQWSVCYCRKWKGGT